MNCPAAEKEELYSADVIAFGKQTKCVCAFPPARSLPAHNLDNSRQRARAREAHESVCRRRYRVRER